MVNLCVMVPAAPYQSELYSYLLLEKTYWQGKKSKIIIHFLKLNWPTLFGFELYFCLSLSESN